MERMAARRSYVELGMVIVAWSSHSRIDTGHALQMRDTRRVTSGSQRRARFALVVIGRLEHRRGQRRRGCASVPVPVLEKPCLRPAGTIAQLPLAQGRVRGRRSRRRPGPSSDVQHLLDRMQMRSARHAPGSHHCSNRQSCVAPLPPTRACACARRGAIPRAAGGLRSTHRSLIASSLANSSR